MAFDLKGDRFAFNLDLMDKVGFGSGVSFATPRALFLMCVVGTLN
jgi:hypothetical protein